MTIDFQGLLQVLKAGEENPELDMRNWTGKPRCTRSPGGVTMSFHCGTSACLIGSFCLTNLHDRLALSSNFIPILRDTKTLSSIEAIAIRFGITEMECHWLFTLNPLNGTRQSGYSRITPSAINLSPEQALARLRKFIYYKLHKQEMIVETGRNKELIHLGRASSGRSSAVLASNA